MGFTLNKQYVHYSITGQAACCSNNISMGFMSDAASEHILHPSFGILLTQYLAADTSLLSYYSGMGHMYVPDLSIQQ